ncbi:hypothetical protein [Bacillus sp. B15-48]|uniref:hypothetical protein n=1 Tax=Bacillus sp. B15-48 TaxID=1548601 RepID=UPI00193F0595|nr:hypothetical protein [Bacillus sp. B15-48]
MMDYRQQGQTQFFPGGFPGTGAPGTGFPGTGFPGTGFPGTGFPGGPPWDGNISRRLDRLERQFMQLDRRVDRIERRLGFFRPEYESY